MVKIPESTIEQIKARADILDVVSEVVTLKRRGANYFGLCPFHDDHKPSMSVSPSKGIYRCFSCGNSGNVITFVMEYDKINFVEALKKLAQRYNIPITWEKGDDDGVKASVISQLYELHEHAKTRYHKQLFSAKGKTALQYLHNRGFTDEVIRKFTIGYATSSWDDLLKNINRKVYNNELLKLSGLFIERKDGSGFFDRFRNRIMFPIKNISGRTIAFGGRAMDPEDPAKYMNSPETKIYNKSDILFGFEVSKDAIRKQEYAIVVEGYTDFLRLFVTGFKNVVAGSGTALTSGHARVLKRFTRKVYLCYDGDEAGQKATVRAGFIFLKAGFDVHVIMLPEKDDPDSYLIEQGPEAFLQKIETAPDFIKFILDRNQEKLQSPVEKSTFIERIVKEISEVEDNVVRDFILKNLAESMSINEERLFGQIKYYLGRRNRSARFDKDQSQSEETKIPEIKTAVDRAEFSILQLVLLQNESVIDFIFHHIDQENFQHPIAKKILQILLHRMESDKSINSEALYNYDWTKAERSLLSRTIADMETLENKDDEILMGLAMDCIEKIILNKVDKEISEIRIKIKNAPQSGDDIMELMHDYKNRQEQKKLISEELRRLDTESPE